MDAVRIAPFAGLVRECRVLVGFGRGPWWEKGVATGHRTASHLRRLVGREGTHLGMYEVT